MDAQYCFMCGASTVALGGRAVPVCAECRGRGLSLEPGDGQWMVERQGGRTKGPLTRTAVLHWIAKNRLDLDDQVGAVGGAMVAIADHPSFRGCFIPGSEDEQEIARIRNMEARTVRRASLQRWVDRGVALLLAVVGLGALFLGLTGRTLVLPPTVLDQIEHAAELVAELRAPVTEVAVEVVSRDLPHAAWVQAHKRVNEDPLLALHRARRGLWEGESSDLDVVRRDFLTAMAGRPMDPMPMVGLLEVNAETLSTRPELFGEMTRTVSRLEVLAPQSAAVKVARAAVALAQGNRLHAMQNTEECAAVDPSCALIHGEAASSLTSIQAVRGSTGQSPRVLRALGRTALGGQDWVALERITQTMIDEMPQEGSGFALRAEHRAAIGEWEEAMALAAWAVRLDPNQVGSLHLQAATTLLVSRRPAEALPLYERLVEHHLLAGYPRRQTVLIQGAMAALQTGNLAQARAWAEGATDAVPSDPGALLVRAHVRLAEGNGGAAEADLRAIESGPLEGRDGAEVHLWSSRMFFDMGKQRLAWPELDSAEQLLPRWSVVLEERAWAKVSTGDVFGAIHAVYRIALGARGLDIRRDPREGIGLGYPPRRSLTGPILRNADRDVRFEAEREPVAAILAWMYRRRGAINHLREVAEIHSGTLAVRAALAQAAYEAREWEEALLHATNVVSREPRETFFHLIRSEALFRLGQVAEAKEALRRTRKQANADPLILNGVIRLAVEMGDRADAVAIGEEASAQLPEDVGIRRSILDLERTKE